VIIPIVGPPGFSFDKDSNCRSGPGTAYEPVTSFNQGETVSIKGQNGGEPRWWLVSISDSSNWQCWVSDVTGETSGQLGEVPIVVVAEPTTVTPTFTATIEVPVYHPPVITSVSFREEWSSSGKLIVLQDIAFYDEDGDAYGIDYEIISDPTNGTVADGVISASSQEQKSGTIVTGSWYCIGGLYDVTMQVTLLDYAGYQSNTVVYTMTCHDYYPIIR